MTPVPPLWQHLCDDAAIFPPGNAHPAQAVVDHERRRGRAHADLVGPLVLSAAVLGELDPLLGGQPDGSLAVTVTVPAPNQVGAAVDQVASRPALHLRMVEVALAEDEPGAACDMIRSALADSAVAAAVEVPRDDRRPATLDLLAERAVSDGWIAKFRTGGLTRELYPSADELATAIVDCVQRDLPFKCTAGMHRAIRHTDQGSGVDEHGFANVLVATQRALVGERADVLAGLLDERDGVAIAVALRSLQPDEVVQVRSRFRSFGTCSIAEPLADLLALGLLAADDTRPVTDLPQPDAPSQPDIRRST